MPVARGNVDEHGVINLHCHLRDCSFLVYGHCDIVVCTIGEIGIIKVINLERLYRNNVKYPVGVYWEEYPKRIGEDYYNI